MTPEELAELLEIPGVELRLTGEQALPRDEAAQGYAAQSLERIAQRLDEQGDVLDVLPGKGGIIQHLQWALGTYFVAPASEEERLEVVRGDFLDLENEELLVRGDTGPAVLRVITGGVTSGVYVLGSGRAELWSVERASSSLAEGAVNVPDLEILTGGLAGPSDVEAEFSALQRSVVVLDRVAAAGLALRFWAPRDRKARQQLLSALGAAEVPWLSAVRTWYSGLSAKARSAVARLALEETENLNQSLGRLDPIPEAEQARALAIDLALRRDRLESVRRVLLAGGEAAELTRATQALDNTAAIHLTQLAELRLADRRLQRVATCEPEAWWGAISE